MRADLESCTACASELEGCVCSRPAQTKLFYEKNTRPPDRDGLDCASCCCRATDVCRDISLCIDVVDALSRRCARLTASPRVSVLLLCLSVSVCECLCGSLSCAFNFESC